jgi:hypothetical protein
MNDEQAIRRAGRMPSGRDEFLALPPRTTAVVVAALVIGLAPAPAAGDAGDVSAPPPRSEVRPAAGWTRTLNGHLTPRRLDLPADASPRRLARAALKRHARQLGLPPSLSGVRFTRALHLPVGPAGASTLRSLRFQQTVGGVRVVWSKLDVAVTRRGVSSITATVVPVTGDRLRRGRRVSRVRALRIARHHVRGPERALRPQLVAYAGTPTTRKTRRRAPRLAYVVEALPARVRGERSPTPLCVVIDAQTGKVIATWKGHAARPARWWSATAAPATASGQREDPITTIIVYDAQGASLGTAGPGERRGGWVTFGDPFVRANWSDVSDRTFSSDLGVLNFNVRNVVVHMCFTRYFCSRNGLRDGTWEPFLATGNARDTGGGAIFLAPSRVAFSPRTGRGDDIVAHELGHLMDYVYGDDRTVDTDQTQEVGEALADMFAYDYDREDATWGEDVHGSGPLSRNWADPGAVTTPSGDRYPARMAEYDCTSFDEHFNSTILSHAYYLFVQRVGHPVAGYILHYVSSALPPRPTFGDVKNAFLTLAGAIYRNNPEVPAAAQRAFVDEVGIGRDDPACSRERLGGGPGPMVPPTERPTP